MGSLTSIAEVLIVARPILRAAMQRPENELEILVKLNRLTLGMLLSPKLISYPEQYAKPSSLDCSRMTRLLPGGTKLRNQTVWSAWRKRANRE